MPLTADGPACECGRGKHFVRHKWRCMHCTPCEYEQCSKCDKPRDQPYKKDGKTYYRCRRCREDNARVWHVTNRVCRNRRATLHANQAGQMPAPDKPKPVWQPVWAAQSRPEIVAAVRDYRKAAKSLGVGA